MNQRPQGFLLAKAIEGFLQFKTAEALSPRTIESYKKHLEQWLDYAGDVKVSRLTTANVRAYLAYMFTEFVPRRIAGGTQPLKPKSIRNIWITLSSFFTWASTEFNIPSPMKAIPAPKFETAPVEPFTREQVESLLKACDYCDEAKTENRKHFVMRRATSYRDRAIIVMLLDTGLRASELCALTISDVDMKSGKVTLKHGSEGGAKGGKGRTVRAGKSARRTLWRYLAGREDADDPRAPLFVAKNSRYFNRDSLRQVIAALGQKAKVPKCHPHRFRHTFAITYLRSGGDVFTLQELMGHSTLEMVQHYARLAERDVDEVHKRASPADNWRL